MKKLISADEVLMRADSYPARVQIIVHRIVENCKDLHPKAYWKEMRMDVVCSRCGENVPKDFIDTYGEPNYCPWCGAEMEEI